MRVVKHNVTRILRTICNDDDKDIINMLKCMKTISTREPSWILIAEILNPNNLRILSQEFYKEKEKELDCLVERGTFQIVLEKNVQKATSILGGIFLLVMKKFWTDQELFNARFFVQSHTDLKKPAQFPASPNLGKQTMRILSAIPAIFGMFSVVTELFSSIPTKWESAYVKIIILVQTWNKTLIASITQIVEAAIWTPL